MARSAQGAIPLRGPYKGLDLRAAQRTPLDACKSCLNVETSQGDIRRRPALRSFQAPTSPRVVLRTLRMKPFFYAATGHETAECAYLATVSWMDDPSQPLVYIWKLTDGGTGWEFGPLYTDEAVAAGVEAYHFAIVPLGACIYLRDAGAYTHAILYKATGSSTWLLHPFFLTAPATTTTQGGAGQGTLVPGTYYYRAFYRNTVSGVDSPAGPWNSSQVADNSKITVTVAAATDAGVDRVLIYRKQDTVDTDFYLVGDVAYPGGALVWDDIGILPDKIKANTLDVLASLKPDGALPGGSDASWWRSRLWLDVAPNTLYYSDYAKAGAFRVEQSLAIGAADDRIIRHLGVAGTLFVLKRRSVWAVTGSGPESFHVTELLTGEGHPVGLASKHGVLEAAGRLWFAGWDGLYSTDGTNIERVSDAVTPLWAAYVNLHWRTLGYDPQRDLVIVSGYTAADYSTLQTLVYHVPSGQWYVWDLNASCVCAAALSQSTPPQCIAAVRAGGMPAGGLAVLRADGEAEQRDYASAAVAWHYQFGDTDGGTPYPKCFTHASVSFERDAAATTDPIELTATLDQGGTPTTRNVLSNQVPAIGKCTLGRVGHTLGLRLSGTHKHRPRITAVDLEAQAIGQR